MRNLERNLERRLVQWLVALPLVAGALAHAQAPAPLPAEHFFASPALLQVQLSPSGRRVAIAQPTPQGRTGLMVIDLGTQPFQARWAAGFGDADVARFHWVDDERLVFSLADRQAGLAEDRFRAPGLYAVRQDGQELRLLVETRGRPRVSGGGRFESLPWNHSLLHVPAPAEDVGVALAPEVIVGEWSVHAGELQGVHPWRLNTLTGQKRRIDTGRLPCPAVAWWFSPRGQPRAIQCSSRDGRDSLHALLPARDGQPARWVPIAEAPLNQLSMRPVWAGEDETLYVEHPRGPAGEQVVAAFDFALGRPGAALVSAPGFDFLGELLADATGQRLLGVRVDTDAEQTVWFDPVHKALQARVDAALPGRVNRIECRRCALPDTVVLVHSHSDREPGELMLFRPNDHDGAGRWLRVGRRLPHIDAAQMARTGFHRIAARDGRDLPVWVTQPPGPPGARPAVVLVHGGPWLRGRRWQWQALPQFLASRGYVVVEPEFRGSDGYGLAHLQAGFRQWGQAMQDDVADAATPPASSAAATAATAR